MTLLMPRAMVKVLRVFWVTRRGRPEEAPAADIGFILVEAHEEREPHLSPECRALRAAAAARRP
jgi:hypothetical protein